MTTARSTHRATTARKASGLIAEIADLFQNLVKAMLDPYRPELHYMRGPGPKCMPSTPAALTLGAMAVHALVPVRIRR